MTAAPLALDFQSIEALEALGFTVGDERAAARIGGATVAVTRSADLRRPEFEVEIIFSNGSTLRAHARRRDLLAATNTTVEKAER